MSSSSSSNHVSKKRYTFVNTSAISLGCSSRLCRRPKLSAIFHPRPRRHHNHNPSSATSSSTRTATFSDTSNNAASATTTTTDYYYSSNSSSSHNNNSGSVPREDDDDDVKSLRAVQGFGRIGGASVAVEIDSDDIYLDFRQSMLQMILEREIYSKEDLKELLNCFLQLNSPYYHGIIVRAFTEIWNGVYDANGVSQGGGGGVHGLWMSGGY